MRLCGFASRQMAALATGEIRNPNRALESRARTQPPPSPHHPPTITHLPPVGRGGAGVGTEPGLGALRWRYGRVCLLPRSGASTFLAFLKTPSIIAAPPSSPHHPPLPPRLPGNPLPVRVCLCVHACVCTLRPPLMVIGSWVARKPWHECRSAVCAVGHARWGFCAVIGDRADTTYLTTFKGLVSPQLGLWLVSGPR